MDILQEIIANKRTEVEKLKSERPLDSIQDNLPDNLRFSFKRVLSNDTAINIIAELKRGSPSRGLIASDFDPVKFARLYREGGAAALSVLTDPKYFYGRYEYIEMVKLETGLPVLCKDFILDPYQIYYARYMNADAILLIVKLLPSTTLSEFISLAQKLGLDCLVEVHGEEEVQAALDSGADIVGVNNRNLHDFSVNLETSETLAPFIPDDVVKIAESGIFTFADVTRLQAAGYTNFLVGEALVVSDDPVSLLKSLRGG
ncbi:MAG: indole-3-glycerol phosphate synthase TrpC [Candidatus Zixiibacteriota bacterium]